MKKKWLSFLLAFAICLFMLPQIDLAANSEVTVSTWGEFTNALKNSDVTTIKLTGTIVSDQPSGDDALVIGSTGRDITITGGKLSLQRAGIVLGGNVVLKDIELSFNNSVRNAIIANGYSLTLQNVSNVGRFNVSFFCGTITDYCGKNADEIPTPGQHGKITLIGKNNLMNALNNVSSNIYAGSLSDVVSGVSDKENVYSGAATIDLSSNVDRFPGNIYACGARENRNGGSANEMWEEPFLYKVTGNVTIDLGRRGANVYGETGGSKNATVIFTDDTTGYLTTLTLKNIGGLSLQGSKVNVQMSSDSSFQDDADVTIPANTKLDLSEMVYDPEIGSLTGGGTLILGRWQSISINGSVSGQTDVAIGSFWNGYSSEDAVKGHSYINAPQSSENSFKLIPISGENTVFQRANDGKWTAVEPTSGPVTTSITDDMVTLTQDKVTYNQQEQKPVVTVANGGAPLTKDTDYLVTYQRNGEDTHDFINAGEIEVTIQGQGAYTGTVQKTYTIQKATSPSIDWPTASDLTYGQSLANSTLSGGSTNFGTFQWTTPSTIPSSKKPGYSVTFTPSADTEQNYEPIQQLTHDVNVTVAKATPTIKVDVSVTDQKNGKNADFEVTVTGVTNGEKPGGNIHFTADGNSLDYTATLDHTGKATYTWTGLNESSYSVKVEYKGDDNYQSMNKTVNLNTSKQTQDPLVITPVGTKTYGDAPFTLSTTGGSGTGDVVFTSSDPSVIRISGHTATIHKNGTATITATKAGDTTFAETTATMNITVEKKVIVFKAKNISVKQGEAMPSFTYESVVLAQGDTITTEPTASCAVSDTSKVGDFDIIFSGAMLNNQECYSIRYQPGKLIVTGNTSGGSTPVVPPTPPTPDTPVVPPTPSTPDTPVVPPTPSTPDTPVVPPTPSTPDTPVVPPTPTTPDTPDAPSTPSTPTTPDTPDVPSTPTTPDTPDVPPTSSAPNTTVVSKEPTKATVEVETKVSKNTANVTLTNKQMTEAIKAAQDYAKQNKSEQNGILVEIKVATKNAETINMTLPKASVDELIKADVKETRLNSNGVDIHLDIKALKEVQKQLRSDVTIHVEKVATNKLPSKAKKTVGNHPVYDFSITGKNGKKLTHFGAGTVSISIPYTLGKNEKPGNVVAYYINSKGDVQEILNSVYDPVTQILHCTTNHFSLYAVGYKESKTSKFTDTANHWAMDSIEFVSARGLLQGTSTGKFHPNTAVSRGMFATALGKLAKVDTSKYKVSRFTDVKSGFYFLPYVEWAHKNGVIKGITEKTFAPNESITREQMAVMMQNYAKAIGFDLPEVRVEAIFTDENQISDYARDAVKQMQMAGVLSGKSGNLFDPQGKATRAEVSALLKRFVELINNTDYAKGWTQNDSGKWLYYKDSQALTGKQIIAGIPYEFNQDGELNENPKDLVYDAYTVQKDDSFFSIAKKYNCGAEELAKLNNRNVLDVLKVKESLKVPKAQ